MGRVGLALLVTTFTVRALATEPTATSSEPELAAYAQLPLTEARSHAKAPLQFEPAEPPARWIRVVLDAEAVASFAAEDDALESGTVVPSPPRLRSIRQSLDDVFEHVGATHRLIRRSLEDYGEFAPVSAARRLRGTLD